MRGEHDWNSNLQWASRLRGLLPFLFLLLIDTELTQVLEQEEGVHQGQQEVDRRPRQEDHRGQLQQDDPLLQGRSHLGALPGEL